MTREQFIGTWKLVSTDYRDAEGKLHHPYGQNPVGVLMYESGGHMAAQIMRRDRPTFESIDRHSGTPEQFRAAFTGYVAYFGAYVVDEQESSVMHHVEGSLLPNAVSTDQKRFFEFTANRLTLCPPPRTIGGLVLSGHLV